MFKINVFVFFLFSLLCKSLFGQSCEQVFKLTPELKLVSYTATKDMTLEEAFEHLSLKRNYPNETKIYSEEAIEQAYAELVRLHRDRNAFPYLHESADLKMARAHKMALQLALAKKDYQPVKVFILAKDTSPHLDSPRYSVEFTTVGLLKKSNGRDHAVIVDPIFGKTIEKRSLIHHYQNLHRHFYGLVPSYVEYRVITTDIFALEPTQMGRSQSFNFLQVELIDKIIKNRLAEHERKIQREKELATRELEPALQKQEDAMPLSSYSPGPRKGQVSYALKKVKKEALIMDIYQDIQSRRVYVRFNGNYAIEFDGTSSHGQRYSDILFEYFESRKPVTLNIDYFSRQITKVEF